MLKKISFLIFVLFLTQTSKACTCSGSAHFDLYHYDSYEYVFEVKINSKYVPIMDTLKKDSLIPSPPSFYNSNLYKSYNISIIEDFKGNIDLTKYILSFADFSSCAWAPTVGETYLFYTHGYNGVDACNRKLTKSGNPEEFAIEQEMLRTLRDAPPRVSITLNNQVLIEGTNVNGKRNGVWKIYSVEEDYPLAYSLTYAAGKLVKLERGTRSSNDFEERLFSYAREFYNEELNRE